jgi:hypothetical protein
MKRIDGFSRAHQRRLKRYRYVSPATAWFGIPAPQMPVLARFLSHDVAPAQHAMTVFEPSGLIAWRKSTLRIHADKRRASRAIGEIPVMRADQCTQRQFIRRAVADLLVPPVNAFNIKQQPQRPSRDRPEA